MFAHYQNMSWLSSSRWCENISVMLRVLQRMGWTIVYAVVAVAVLVSTSPPAVLCAKHSTVQRYLPKLFYSTIDPSTWHSFHPSDCCCMHILYDDIWCSSDWILLIDFSSSETWPNISLSHSLSLEQCICNPYSKTATIATPHSTQISFVPHDKILRMR